MLRNVSLSFSPCIGAIERFEDMMASFTMIGSPPMLVKNKKIAKTTNLVLAFKRGLMFLSWKLG
jgi:hypothetical protein